jgi:hypothetical protein
MLTLVTILISILVITAVVTFAIEKYMAFLKSKIDMTTNVAEKTNIKNIYDMFDIIYMLMWSICAVFCGVVMVGIFIKFVIYISSFVI